MQAPKETRIQKLFITAITNIRQHYDNRTLPAHKACKKALKALQKNLDNEDLQLFGKACDIFFKLMKSGIKNKDTSFTCQTLAESLFQASEMIAQYFNNITAEILGHPIKGVYLSMDALDWESMNPHDVPAKPLVTFPYDEQLSLVDKRVIMEQAMDDYLEKYLYMLTRSLNRFKPDLYRQKHFTLINSLNILNILCSIPHATSYLPLVENIVKSPFAQKRFALLLDNDIGPHAVNQQSVLFNTCLLPLFANERSLDPIYYVKMPGHSLTANKHTIARHKLILSIPCFQRIGFAFLAHRLNKLNALVNWGCMKELTKVNLLLTHFQESLTPEWLFDYFKKSAPEIKTIIVKTNALKTLPTRTLFGFFAINQLALLNDIKDDMKQSYFHAELATLK